MNKDFKIQFTLNSNGFISEMPHILKEMWKPIVKSMILSTLA